MTIENISRITLVSGEIVELPQHSKSPTNTADKIVEITLSLRILNSPHPHKKYDHKLHLRLPEAILCGLIPQLETPEQKASADDALKNYICKYLSDLGVQFAD